ncbi:MAG TPA: HEAT repeat domain-containing protein [Pyrinomonadaceae bacterium]|jgi:hypothetical protein
MKRYLLLIVILLASGAFGQDKPKLIGEIEFFGYSGIDQNKVRAALPFHEQDTFSLETSAKKLEQVGEAVKQVTGQWPTDVANVCCDAQGNWIIFIGLSGKTIRYNPPPTGATTRLPEKIIKLYERFIKVNLEGVQKGAYAEDDSKGYALAEYPPLRSIQLEMRAYAVNHEVLLRAVLANSSEDGQRIVAAELLGYSQQSRSQIAALVKASQDSNDTVRNNATRALIVLAKSSTKIATEIPAAGFIELLLSGTWTDLNKVSNLLNFMTKSRDSEMLAGLRRREVLDRLIEIARWRSHGEPARYILGRIAGIDESRLEQLVKTGQVEVIINELKGK